MSEEGGTRYEYAAARRAMRARTTDFPTHPCIMVGWDNTPRRGADAIVLTDSTPERFEAGLREVVNSVADRSFEERLVFVNAWNEWAEGNHLEPDARHGLAYLEAVDRVSRGIHTGLLGLAHNCAAKIILTNHAQQGGWCAQAR